MAEEGTFCIHDVDFYPSSEDDLVNGDGTPFLDYVSEHGAVRQVYGTADCRGPSMGFAFTGGVVCMHKDDYLRAGGWSLNFWGWGHEDDNMSWRFKRVNMAVKRMLNNTFACTSPHVRRKGTKKAETPQYTWNNKNKFKDATNGTFPTFTVVSKETDEGVTRVWIDYGYKDPLS